MLLLVLLLLLLLLLLLALGVNGQVGGGVRGHPREVHEGDINMRDACKGTGLAGTGVIAPLWWGHKDDGPRWDPHPILAVMGIQPFQAIGFMALCVLLCWLVGSTHDPAPHGDEGLVAPPGGFKGLGVAFVMFLSTGIFSTPISSTLFLWLEPFSFGGLVCILLLLKLLLLAVLIMLDTAEELLLWLLLMLLLLLWQWLSLSWSRAKEPWWDVCRVLGEVPSSLPPPTLLSSVALLFLSTSEAIVTESCAMGFGLAVP